MPDGNQTTLPGLGHNAPPPFRANVVEAHAAKAAEFLDAAGAWIEAAPIKDDEQAAKLNDFLAGVKGVIKNVDSDRKDDKKPHDDAGKAVQAAYSPVLDKLKRAVDRVQPILSAFLVEKERRQREEAERQRREAEAAARAAAEAAAKAAARNDIAGEVEAEAAAERAAQAQKDADRAAKAKANVGSATGGARTAALRTTWVAEVTNLRVTFMHYQNDPEVAALFKRLAEAEARSKDFDPRRDTIPGVTLHERKV